MPNNDCIKRDDALFELYRYASAKDPALMIAYRVDLCERIEAIPAADVASVKHGRWLRGGDVLPYLICSECEEPMFGEVFTDYCPHCGAKMDEEKR